MKETAEEIAAKNLLEAGLADLAVDMTTRFQSAGEDFLMTVSLHGPETLTVEKAGTGYSKVAHIGGEDFTPFEAYVGKRRQIIVKFRPNNVASYSHMEMSAAEAIQHLSGFEEIINQQLLDGDGNERLRVDYNVRNAAIHKEASELREREKNADKFETYADIGFGSF